MKNRATNLLNKIKHLSADAVLVTSYENRRYLSGFSGSNATLILSDNVRVLITDFRYQEQAAVQAPGYEVLLTDATTSTFDIIKNILGSRAALAFEAEKVTVSFLEEAQKALPLYAFVQMKDEIEQLRAIKDEDELARITKAQKVTDDAFSLILNDLKVGIKETEVAAKINYYMAKEGCPTSFSTIVASGPNGSMPHAVPTERALQKGDFVTMDFGCIYDGYCSDMTRTVAIGEPTEKMQQVYQIVLDAQAAALAKIKPEEKCKVVDAAARELITNEGYGDYFGHGTGHSFGLAVHENPRCAQTSTETLKTGHCMSCEPGIYLPQEFGVRIEDTVVVTAEGYHNFTESNKELLILS